MDGRRPAEMRRTMTLSDQLLATPDPVIRDFLKIPLQDDDAADAGLRDADNGSAAGGGVSNWKPLRDRLRLRRAANAWQRSSAAAPAPKQAGGAAAATTNSGGVSNRSSKYIYAPGEAAAAFSRAPSLRTTPTFSRVSSSTRVGPNSFLRSSSRRPASFEIRNDDHDDGEEEDEDDDVEEEGNKEEAPAAAQMSLMALLEQTDSWDDDDDDEEEGSGGARRNGGGSAGDDDEDDGGEAREEEMVHVCCVCMVRHKGAAFIPCGHTFCRLCSRELWVSRGNCPLCNGFIQEILDIF